MRALVLVIAAVITAVFASPIAASPAAAAEIPTLSITILGETQGTNPVFQTVGLSTTGQILVPQVPIRINLTFVNNESAASGMLHTFTINNNAATPVHMIDIPLNPQENYTLEFTVSSLGPNANVTVNGTSFTPETDATTNGIVYFCIPHRALGMTGVIILATAAQGQAVPEKGMLIRAYWIGMIGIAATLVWIGITYFVIKSSSPRFKDHRAHVRKGLP